MFDRKVHDRAYRLANKAKAKAYNRTRYLAKSEEIGAYSKAYRLANQEHTKAYSKGWRLAKRMKKAALNDPFDKQLESDIIAIHVLKNGL